MPVHLSSISTAAQSRMMLRHTRYVARQTMRRHASTTEAAANTAAKSKETASNATSKASRGLSRVTSSARPAVSGAAQRVSKAINNLGGRTGRMISFVQCKPNPVTYSQSCSPKQLRGSKLFSLNNGRSIHWTSAHFLSFWKLKPLISSLRYVHLQSLLTSETSNGASYSLLLQGWL